MVIRFLARLRVILARLWVRATTLAALGVAVALVSSPLAGLLPRGLRDQIDAQTLSSLLNILSSSLLGVTTFSLSIMVTSHLSADKGVTPRGHRLLQDDDRTLTVLASFVGAFVYALSLIVLQDTGVITQGDEAGVYLVTVAVILFVVVALLRWIHHLNGLGSLEETAIRVDERARRSLKTRPDFLGGRAFDGGVPAGSHVVTAQGHGWLLEVDMTTLNARADSHDVEVHLALLPGAQVVPGTPLLHTTGALDDDAADQLRACFPLGDRREFAQDTTYPLVVLAEIGERALSPGINDPRSAIDVVARILKYVDRFRPEREQDTPDAPRVHVPPLNMATALEQSLDRVARDGRTFVEVLASVQIAYVVLARHDDRAIAQAAHRLSSRLLAYAEDGLLLREDLDRLRDMAPDSAKAAPRLAQADEDRRHGGRSGMSYEGPE